MSTLLPTTVSGFTQSTPVPLFFRADGPEDAPPVLLLHGGPGAHHDYLYPQFLALADRYRLITYDQRGGGQSRTDDPSPITWETQVSDLAAVIREFGLVPPTIIGYSWGALLAMLYAIAAADSVSASGSAADSASAAPHNTVADSAPLTVRATSSDAESAALPAELPAPARLVLVSPAPITREWRDTFESTLAERQRSEAIGGARQALAESGLRADDPDAYRQRAFELSVAGYFADPARAHSLTPFRVTGRVQQSIWASLGRYDLGQKLRGVRVPALVVHGRQDPIPIASAEAAARALNARFEALDDCGHVPYVEQPERLFGSIRNFLEQTAAHGAPAG